MTLEESAWVFFAVVVAVIVLTVVYCVKEKGET
jgi:hypothetical protein